MLRLLPWRAMFGIAILLLLALPAGAIAAHSLPAGRSGRAEIAVGDGKTACIRMYIARPDIGAARAPFSPGSVSSTRGARPSGIRARVRPWRCSGRGGARGSRR
jgi:hypothetical protein